MHSQTDIQGCYAGRSALTNKVNVDIPLNFNSLNHLNPSCSGQLRNLGSSRTKRHTMRACHQRPTNGFTLIELMITVAIVAVIAVIALPSFRGQILKSHRTDAKVTLSETAQRLERCYTEFNTYLYNATSAPGCPRTADLASQSEYYGFTLVVAASGLTYTLTATATGGQLDDKNCKTFTLKQTGDEASTNASNAASNNCWK